MSFIKEFINRGYFYQCTDIDKLKNLMEEKSIIAYIGFDCTASSLHVGNLMQIMILRLLQQYGHKPIVIIGGATSKIGDPTDKDEMRKFLSEKEIQLNIEGIKKSLSKFLRFGEGESDAIILNNSTWLESINYIEFLRDCGKLISINRMLTMDSVKSRLDREQSLSFLEFNYMILQAFDFSYLNKNYNCVLQLGGSDQWGNIISGVELTRKLNGKEVFGLTTPLLTTASGVKMGKSLGGAVWLNEDLLSPYKYYQYWRNCEDPDVVRFAKLYTEYNERELEEFKALSIKNINSAKKQLAYRLTELCHGKVAANEALETSIKVFEEGGIDENLPTQYIPYKKITQGVPAFELFFEARLCSSKSEARKLIRGNGAKINDQKVEDENKIINEKFIINGLIKLSTGKKNHKLLKVT